MSGDAPEANYGTPRPDRRVRRTAVGKGLAKHAPAGPAGLRTPVICFDMDGTLVDADGRIHRNDVELLARGTSAFLPASGRPLHSVRKTFERHGLFAGVRIPLPLVLQNGAAVYLPGEVPHSNEMFEPGERAALLRIASGFKKASFFVFGVDELVLLHPDAEALDLVRRFDVETRLFEEADFELPLTKLSAISPTPRVLRWFEELVAGLPLERAYSLPNVLEVSPPGVTKAVGLSGLMRDEGRARASLLVAGDGENDLSLFDLADVSFAPADSPEKIRGHADHVLDVGREGLLAPMLRAVGAAQAARDAKSAEIGERGGVG